MTALTQVNQFLFGQASPSASEMATLLRQLAQTIDTKIGNQTFLIPITMASLANTQVFQIDPGFAGTLISINFRDTVAVTTTGKAASLQAQVNGVSVTGGVVALSGAYAVGAAQAGTAITAGTLAFTAAQTIGFVVSGVTTFIEGSGVVEMTVGAPV